MGRLAAVLVLFWSAMLCAQAPPRDRPRAVDAPPPPRTGHAILRGRIVAASTGDPLRHARVSISGASVAPAQLSDEEGRFTFSSLAAGRYTVSAVKPGFAKTTMTLPVAERALVNAGDVALPRGAVISGFLMNDLGEPFAGMPVTVVRVTPHGDSVQAVVASATETDDAGAFRFGGLTADTYSVLPQFAPGGMFFSADSDTTLDPRMAQRMRFAEAQRITLRTGDERTGLVVVAPHERLPPPPPGPNNLVVSSPDPKSSTTFRGRVTQAGLPVVNAQVVLSAAPGGGLPAATDSRGVYEIVLPQSRTEDFRIFVRKPGFAPVEYGQRRLTGRGTVVHPSPGEVQDHLDVSLVRLGAIAGRIVDDLGEPVEGAVVRPMQVRYVDGVRKLNDVGQPRRTDDLGRFRLFGLRPGMYALSASVGQVVVTKPADDLPGFGTTYFPGTADPSGIRFVSVSPAEEILDVDFALTRERSFRVAGHASDADGEPVTGGIALMPRARSGAISAVQMGARIARDGNFEFLNVPPGDYVLQVSRRGGKAQGNEGEFAVEFVTVSDADVTDLDIQAGLGSTITGHVVVEGAGTLPTDQLTITPTPADLDRTPQIGTGVARAPVDDELRFELSGINGPRRLQLGRTPKGWMLKSVRVQGIEVTDMPLAFGRDDQSLDGVEVVVTDQVTRISGALAAVRGYVPTDFTVFAFSTDRDRWYLNTRFARRTAPNSDGTYQIEGLPASDYYVVAMETPDDPGMWQDRETLEALAMRAEQVRVTEGEHATLALRPLMSSSTAR